MAPMHGLYWWIDRWRKSTAYTDMTVEAQGAYRNLLDEAWLRDGVLPKDERVLAKACGDPRIWHRVRAAVLPKFYETADGLRNETLDGVLHQSRRRAKNQAAYRARYDNKADNAADNGHGNEHDNSATNNPDSPDQDKEHKERTAAPPLRSVGKPKATTWKCAIAIAHKAIEAYPESLADQSDAFKAACGRQGIDYGARGGKDGRALYSRALDYVAGVKARRVAS